MLRKIVLELLVVVAGGAAIAYLNRKSIILHIVTNRDKVEELMALLETHHRDAVPPL